MKKRTPKIFGILGRDISYSLSPSVFEYLFKKHGLPHGYYLFDIADRSPERFVESVKLLGVAGFNVTVPFKCSIIPYLDALDSSADKCCSVNLVKIHSGILTGYNTDIFGIRSVFEDSNVRSFASSRILIIGAGGTARTALRFFQSKRAKDITIINRSKRRLRSLLQAFDLNRPGGTIRAYESAQLKSRLSDHGWDIVFNATPIPTGKIVPNSAIAGDAVIFEAAYAKQNRAARNRKVVGGIDMLVYQAIKGFEMFTGKRVADYSRSKAELRKSLDI